MTSLLLDKKEFENLQRFMLNYKVGEVIIRYDEDCNTVEAQDAHTGVTVTLSE